MTMKIVVHFNNNSTEILSPPPSSDDEPSLKHETWGQLCQRFVETKLLHPPRLLQLLTSLHPDGRLSRYQFRYGDGNATIICPTWSEHGLNSGCNVLSLEDGGTAEANIVLNPRGGALKELQNLTQADVASAALGIKTKRLDVDLNIEKIGIAPTGGSSLPTTQTPFPIDDRRTNILSIVEHSQFEGVVDKFSIEQLLKDSRADENEGANSSSSVSSKNSIIDAIPESEEKRKKVHEAETNEEVGSRNGDATPGKEQKQKENLKDKSGTKHKLAKESTATDTVDKRESSNKPSTKKLGNEKGEAASTENESPKLSTTTKRKYVKKNHAEGKSVDRVESAQTPPSSKKATNSTGKQDLGIKDDNGAQRSPMPDMHETEDKFKRPPNGYMMFASEVRSKIMKKNPGLKITEVAKIIGEEWRALGDEKKRYNVAAHEALEKFKQEHPDHPTRNTKKSKKKKDNEAKEGVNLAVSTKKGDSHDGDKKVAKGEDASKDKLKPPLNAYFLFIEEFKPKIQSENPAASPMAIMSKADAAYKALSEDEKKPYMDAADAAMAKFEKEHGDGDAALKQEKKKNKRKSSSGDAKRKKKLEGGLPALFHDIPAKPAVGLPEGWVTRSMPRKSGDREDMTWFSPVKSYRFRSKSEVKRFLENMKEVGGDDEIAAMVLFLQREEERRSSSGGRSSSKKLKAKDVKNDGNGDDNGISAKEDDIESDKNKEEKRKKKSSDGPGSSKRQKTAAAESEGGGDDTGKRAKNDWGESDDDEVPEAWDA